MAVKWSRVRLVFSILTCEGLFATLRERLQYSPGPKRFGVVGRNAGAQALGMPRHYDYAGAIHIHSTHSDGIGTVAEVAEAANRAGLDFIVLCDHSNLDALAEGGWRGRTLVMVGTEVTTDTGHLLALNVPRAYLPAPSNAVKAQQSILDTGGIGFVALPCDLKDHWRNFDRRLPQTGLEVFNLSSIARAKINLPAAALVWQRYRSRRPQRAFHYVAARPSRELRLWDNLMTATGPSGALQPVVGIASLDAHGVMKVAGRSYQIPTYEEVFRTLRTHVVMSSPLSHGEATRNDLNRVHQALASGQCYMSYDNYGDPTGFVFEALPRAESHQTETLPVSMGASLSLAEASWRLRVQTPRSRSLVRLFRNGKLVAAARGGRLEYAVTEPGAYRAEVFLYRRRLGRLCLGAKPWIFSNPIYVQPSAVAAGRGRDASAVGLPGRL